MKVVNLVLFQSEQDDIYREALLVKEISLEQYTV